MFQDTLKITLELTTGDETLSIPGGNVKAFEVNLLAYGFRGMAEFWVSGVTQQDAVLPQLTAPDPIQARLSIEGVLNLPDPAPDPLVVTGLVVDRAITERTFEGLRGEPVLLRQYTIHFEDPGSVLWRQHFPNQLVADATLEDVIKQHLVEGISLSTAWDPLKSEKPMICLGLGEARVSFYDFLVWVVEKENGVFAYDYDQKSYFLSGGKPGEGEAAALRSTEVERLKVRLPEPRRDSARIQNAYSEALVKSAPVPQDHSVDGVLHDVLLRTPIVADVAERTLLETSRLRSRQQELEVHFKQYPTVPFWPGRLLALQREFFSPELFALTRTYRAYRVELGGRATVQEPDHDRDVAFTGYDLEMSAAWESENDPVAKLPAYQDPRYPIFVEGKIVCEMGEDGDRSYMIYSDPKTSQYFYKVDVPLWNQKIMVPFAPQFVPGHFYLPAYKDARVLLALSFSQAEIVRFLDWGADVQLPAESQGNHILLGKNKTSETSIKHVYVDSLPSLSIRRIANGDIELVEISEGSIVLETKEDQALKQGETKFDLSAQVAAARAKLSMESKSSIAGISSAFEKTNGQLRTEVDGAVNQVKGALSALEGEIGAKADEVTNQMETAADQLAQKAEVLAASATSAKAELKQKMGL
jgi:hypothetical protein